MKAIALSQAGPPENFKRIELPEPPVRPGTLKVRVVASSLNPLDCKVRGGQIPLLPQSPSILHGDFSGVVEEVGFGVKGFEIGDEVFGFVGGIAKWDGVLREFLVVDPSMIAPKPRNLSHLEAACMPLAGITAWWALVERGALKQGESLLVQGGTGGVGHLAVQLGKALGVKVHATASSSEKAELVSRWGAEQVVDVSSEELDDLFCHSSYDAVLDTIGGKFLDQSFRAVSANGRVVSVVARSSHDLSCMHAKGLSLHVVFMLLPLLEERNLSSYGSTLRKLNEVIEGGKLRPHLNERTYGFSEVAEAHLAWERRENVGKIALRADW